MPKAKMSKSNVENGLNRIKAEKIFTDREAPREAFWKLYQEISNDMESYKVLTYYGIGGIGKTTLIAKLIQEVNNKKGKFVSLNFERYESLSKILILRDLGTKLFRLDKNKFKFYRFRFAMNRYAEETGQSLEIKNDNSSFLSNNPLMELGMDLSENVPDIIEKLPIISTISKARCSPITRSPRQRIFALLWALDTLAEYVSPQRAALMPRTLFAAIDIPIPVPQTKIPRFDLPDITLSQTALAISG